MIYETIVKRTWNATKILLLELCEESSHWSFRGQSNPDWPLSTTIDRLKNLNTYNANTIEDELISEFKRGSINYLNPLTIPQNNIEWLSIMQHYGTPTRLLDFTKSPYIATYFGIEGAMEKYFAIWAINSFEINKISRAKILPIIGKPNKGDFNYGIQIDSDENLKKIINSNSGLIVPVEPFRMNERFQIQQGTFFLSGDISQNFESNLIELLTDGNKMNIHSTNIFKKILVPLSEKEKIIQDLYLMNVTPLSLFPGLDGFAKHIKGSYELINKKLFNDFTKNLQNLEDE